VKPAALESWLGVLWLVLSTIPLWPRAHSFNSNCVDLIFNKADIFEFINSYLREFLNNEKYLAVFSSLKNLKDRIDKKEIVPSPINNVEDEGTITLGDPEDED
jgi:hypothetical protein